MGKYNKAKKQQKYNDFILSFFNSEKEYQIKEINGFVLTKNIHPDGRIEGQLFTKESWNNAQEFLYGNKEEIEQANFLRDILK